MEDGVHCQIEMDMMVSIANAWLEDRACRQCNPVQNWVMMPNWTCGM